MEACSIDDISEVLILLGFVMSIFALIHIILGLLTHYEEKECFEFTACAWSEAPIFSTYWVIVIGTGITQFVLQCWAWDVFLGKWPFGPIPSVDYNNKSAENFCEKTPYMYELITCFHEFCNYESTKKITKFYLFTFLLGRMC